MTRARITEQTIHADTTQPRQTGGALSTVLATVLYHRDLGRVGERAVLHELEGGREAQISRDRPLFGHPGQAAQRPLADPHLSRTPIVIAPTHGGGARLDPGEGRTRVAIRGDAVQAPITWSPEELRRGVVIRLGKDVVLLLHRVEVSDLPPPDNLGIVGESPAVHRVLREIRRVADLDAPVLVRGETGSGKELVARALHEASARRGGPFVAVNMAAVPPTLAAAELFGVERGAFTGAFQERSGYFARARGGTLFLDEIGDTPSDVQATLLRVIETGEVQAVGAGKPQQVKVRLVAATDADLEAETGDGRFRAPLLHRLSAHVIWLPPLRERRDDISRLLLHFLREELATAGVPGRLDAPPSNERPWLPASLVAHLAECPFSGNVRQLRNVARHLVATYGSAERADLSPELERLLDAGPRRALASEPAISERPLDAGRSERRKPADISDAELIAALRECRWEPSAAAARLGITRPSLYVLIRRSGRVRTAGDLPAEEIAKSYEEHGGDVERAADALEVSVSALRRRVRELGIART